MQFSLKILGAAELSRHFILLRKKIPVVLEESLRESAALVERYAKIQLTSGPNRALLTGYLRSSIGMTSLLPFQAKVTADANYGIYIHEGTRYMRARPFMEAGLRDALPEIEKVFGKRVKTLVETV